MSDQSEPLNDEEKEKYKTNKYYFSSCTLDFFRNFLFAMSA